MNRLAFTATMNPVGEPLAPFGEVVVRGQPVEGVVYLDGVELGRVVLEPEPLR
jgi:hypothetical protein